MIAAPRFPLRVLVACERSGRVRDAFRLHGHDAWSCDLVPCDNYGPHIQADAIETAYRRSWDLIIAHPPCTYLSRVNVAYRRRHAEMQEVAERFAIDLWNAPADRVCVENPIGSLWTAIGTPNQVVQPWWFGDPYTKATCFWLRGLPRLSSMKGPDSRQSYTQAARAESGERPKRIRHRGVDDWWRWPAPEGVRPWLKVQFTSRMRSQTFWGIALAMAEQWGGLSAEGPYQPADSPISDRPSVL